MNCLMCRTPMERELKKVAGLAMYHCLACGSESSSPRETTPSLHAERHVKAHREECWGCGRGRLAFLEMEQVDATLRTAIFHCLRKRIHSRCNCFDCRDVAKRKHGCATRVRLPEYVWDDLTPGGTLRGPLHLMQREEDEEFLAHGQPPPGTPV